MLDPRGAYKENYTLFVLMEVDFIRVFKNNIIKRTNNKEAKLIIKENTKNIEISSSREMFNYYLKGKFLGDGHFYFSKLKYPVFSISYDINENNLAERDNSLILKHYNINLSKQKTNSENCFMLRAYNILDILKISANLEIIKIPFNKILERVHKNFNLLYIVLDERLRYSILNNLKEFCKNTNLNYEAVSLWKYGKNKIPLKLFLDIFLGNKKIFNAIKENIIQIQIGRKGKLEIKDQFDKYLLSEILKGYV